MINKYIVITFLAVSFLIKYISIISSAEEITQYPMSYVLIESEGKAIISSENENEKMPVGTIAKLMTILIVAEQIESGKLTINDEFKTSAYANSMQGAQIWLMQGEKITVDELLKAVIIGNANDASVVLAEGISGTEEQFVEEMNKYAKKLGMSSTVFTNCNGYYDDNKQISTAYDLALLCSALTEYEFLRDYFTCWHDYVRNGETELVNSNELVKSYKGISGFKAGYSEESGYFVAVGAEKDGVTYISVVIGCNNKEKSFVKATNLMNTAFSEYTVFTPELPQNIPYQINVRRGLSQTAALEYKNIRRIVLPNNAVSSVSSKVIMPEYIYAPVEKGRKVGEIQYFRNDKIIFSIDIVAKEKVNEINISKSFDIILKKLLTF